MVRDAVCALLSYHKLYTVDPTAITPARTTSSIQSARFLERLHWLDSTL